jgi:hypothetical protein
LRPKRLQVEAPAQQALGRLCDHNASALGERLQARRQMGGVADDNLLLRRPMSDGSPTTTVPVAMPMRTCNAAFAGVSSLATALAMSSPARTARSASSSWALKAEISEHAVAHELGDETVVARDRARTGVLIGTDHPPHIFWIEPRRRRSGTDEIAEHYCELAALRDILGGRGSEVGKRRARKAVRAMRLSPSASACGSQEHANFFEVVVRQLIRNFGRRPRTGEIVSRTG